MSNCYNSKEPSLCYLFSFIRTCTLVQELLDNRTGVFESIQCGRTKLDQREQELTPTSTAASLLPLVTSLLPGFLINKLSSSSCCLSTCAYTSYGKYPSAVGSLVPSVKSVNTVVRTGMFSWFLKFSIFYYIYFLSLFKVTVSRDFLPLFLA